MFSLPAISSLGRASTRFGAPTANADPVPARLLMNVGKDSVRFSGGGAGSASLSETEFEARMTAYDDQVIEAFRENKEFKAKRLIHEAIRFVESASGISKADQAKHLSHLHGWLGNKNNDLATRERQYQKAAKYGEYAAPEAYRDAYLRPLGCLFDLYFEYGSIDAAAVALGNYLEKSVAQCKSNDAAPLCHMRYTVLELDLVLTRKGLTDLVPEAKQLTQDLRAFSDNTLFQYLEGDPSGQTLRAKNPSGNQDIDSFITETKAYRDETRHDLIARLEKFIAALNPEGKNCLEISEFPKRESETGSSALTPQQEDAIDDFYAFYKNDVFEAVKKLRSVDVPQGQPAFSAEEQAEQEAIFQRAFSLLDRIPEKTMAARAFLLTVSGRLHFMQNQFDQAEACFTQAVQVCLNADKIQSIPATLWRYLEKLYEKTDRPELAKSVRIVAQKADSLEHWVDEERNVPRVLRHLEDVYRDFIDYPAGDGERNPLDDGSGQIKSFEQFYQDTRQHRKLGQVKMAQELVGLCQKLFAQNL